VFWEPGHADTENPLRLWYRAADRADWGSFAEVRTDFASVDQVGDRLIFDIGGNKYRLIVAVDYRYRQLFVRWIGTHAEYDRLTSERIETV
jgi:mRNA interferase HigB